ncbi:MAG: SDR family NAD(P)-dependent oxidoreductase [Myxococcales bacterium]|nr:MAG: SDR family NAD(P)-dependent oxidoreductase [Myxococcales bacterium]
MVQTKPKHEVVLVTGASSGLGLALSKLLLSTTEHKLILTARESSLPRFEEQGIQQSERVWLRPLDILDNIQRRAIVREAESKLGGITVLVNNAGLAYRSVVEHVTEEERLAQLGVNFCAPMEMTRLVLPTMRDKRHGRIINVSSVGGMMAMPTMATYSASKFALEGASEALWYEVKPWNVFVTLIQPGFIHSGSFQNTRRTHASHISENSELDAYHRHYQFMGPFIAKAMDFALATPEKVAAKIAKTIEQRRPPLRVPATIDAHLFALLRRVLPRGIYHQLLYCALPSIHKWGPSR